MTERRYADYAAVMALRRAGTCRLRAVPLSAYGEIAAMAIDPAGRQAAFGVSATAGGGLYLLRTGGVPMLLSSLAQPVAAAFDESGSRLYAIDLGTASILEFDSGVGFQFAPLPHKGGAPPDPVGLGVSGDGRYLLVADRASRAVHVYDTASRALASTIPLDFAPSRMEALTAGPVFLLNGDRRDEWLMVLDARTIPQVYFVPAITEPTKEERQ